MNSKRNLYRAATAPTYWNGDNVRMGLCKDLGFSAEDREENIRRIGEVSKLFMDAGIVVLSAFVSPYRADRDAIRELVEEGGIR